MPLGGTFPPSRSGAEGFPRLATGPVTWCGITHRAYNGVVQNERAPSGRVNNLRWRLTEADRHGIIETLRTRQSMAGARPMVIRKNLTGPKLSLQKIVPTTLESRCDVIRCRLDLPQGLRSAAVPLKYAP